MIQEYRNAGLVQNKNIRVAKYLVPVIIVSVLLNVPKFLETSVAYDEETGEVQGVQKRRTQSRSLSNLEK